MLLLLEISRGEWIPVCAGSYGFVCAGMVFMSGGFHDVSRILDARL